jgi:hypothetical protein
MDMTYLKALALAAAIGAAATTAAAEGADAVRLVLKDHRFTPDEVHVPAGRKIRIELVNQDAASEEFDSEDLQVEKDVTPHGRASFEIGPLAPGRYSFMGELHADTASGVVVADGPPATP